MTKASEKSADNQSEARISVAYNKNCHLSLMTSLVKRPPGVGHQVNPSDCPRQESCVIHTKSLIWNKTPADCRFLRMLLNLCPMRINKQKWFE